MSPQSGFLSALTDEPSDITAIGLQIILPLSLTAYFYLSADHQVWFFTLYGRDEAADLTTEEKKVLKKAIQAELEARRRKS